MISKDRNWVEISLENISNNIREIVKNKKVETKVMAIVKADGYGHGAREIVPCLEKNGADFFGVATIDEAIDLRNAGILKPILILAFTPKGRYEDILKYDLSQTVYSYETALEHNKMACAFNKKTVVHIKIDTGMSRLGFLPNDNSLEEIRKVLQMQNLVVEGIFTHFAQSDLEESDFTDEQLRLFKYITENLEDIPIKHAANSAATILSQKYHLDMVRPGLMLYGLIPCNAKNLKNYNLQPALSWKSQISSIRTLAAQKSVGYSRSYFTQTDTIIATVPVGYADGYSRKLSNNGYMLVNGQKAPIVGKVCMDQTMIDVTNIKNVKVADEVVLLGSQGESHITADDLADFIGTINYEIVSGIGKRVPRYYSNC